MRSPEDPIDWNPQRIAVAGTSGAGKTTFADALAVRLGLPRVEIDSLHHGPGWVRRPGFVEDVEAFTAQDQWVIESQYRDVRPLIAERADTLLWLDYPVPLTLHRLVRRTLRRRLTAEELWNGNREAPLRTLFTDPDHIIRWGYRTRHRLRPVVPWLPERFPPLTVVRFSRPSQTAAWLSRLPKEPSPGCAPPCSRSGS